VSKTILAPNEFGNIILEKRVKIAHPVRLGGDRSLGEIVDMILVGAATDGEVITSLNLHIEESMWEGFAKAVQEDAGLFSS